MVKTGMNYFEIGITSGSQELVRKMRMGYNLRVVLAKLPRLKSRWDLKILVSVNYSFNVIDESLRDYSADDLPIIENWKEFLEKIRSNPQFSLLGCNPTPI